MLQIFLAHQIWPNSNSKFLFSASSGQFFPGSSTTGAPLLNCQARGDRDRREVGGEGGEGGRGGGEGRQFGVRRTQGKDNNIKELALNFTGAYIQVGSGMDLFPESGKKGFRLRKGHKEERAGGKVEFDSKKVSHSTPAKIFKFSHNLNVFKESNALHFATYHS